MLDGKPLYACQYYMARGHWQIVEARRAAARRYGRVETLPLEQRAARRVELAVQAARLIGDGLYGVDLKEVGGRFLVIEVNDNPNIDAGCRGRGARRRALPRASCACSASGSTREGGEREPPWPAGRCASSRATASSSST